MNFGNCIRACARLFGSKICDDQTGEFLGKAILVTFRGRLWVLGYTGKKGLRPVPVVSSEIRYWVQEMRFRAAEEPDYPRLEK
jgi:hypothetical protein